MALVTFSRGSMVSPLVDRVLTDNGYVDISASPFIGQAIGVLKDALQTDISKIYEIAQNVDIGRAAGEFLDRWGNFMNESRETLTYANDLTLNNVYIELSPAITAGEITIDGGGIEIPERTVISSSQGADSVLLVSPAYIRADRTRAFCRVIAARPGSIYIMPGSLDTLNFTLEDVSNVIPSALAKYRLTSGNMAPIAGGTELSDDASYQYILKEAGASLGLFNSRKVNTLMDIAQVVSISVQEYFGGVNIFLETADPAQTLAVVEMARVAMNSKRGLGAGVSVYPPIFRQLKLALQIELEYPETNMSTIGLVKTSLYEKIIANSMGASLDLSTIVNNTKLEFSNIIGLRIASATYNGRTLLSYGIGQKFNEKAIITEKDITIS